MGPRHEQGRGLLREHGPADRRGGQAHRHDAQTKARSLLTANKKILDDLAGKLFDREVLNGEEIDAILTAARA